MIETKVQASTAAAAVAGLTLFVLGRYVFKGAVPDVITSWVYALVPAGITFAAGYLARHTPRPAPLSIMPLPPDMTAAPPPPPVPPGTIQGGPGL